MLFSKAESLRAREFSGIARDLHGIADQAGGLGTSANFTRLKCDTPCLRLSMLEIEFYGLPHSNGGIAVRLLLLPGRQSQGVF